VVKTPAGVLNVGARSVQPLNELSAAGYIRPQGNEFVLRPGESTRLFVDVRHTVHEWTQFVEKGQLAHHIRVTVTDTFAEGISDETDLVVAGEPLVSLGHDWQASGRLSELRVIRTVRHYQRVLRDGDRQQ
jgi:hypothetical protein